MSLCPNTSGQRTNFHASHETDYVVDLGAYHVCIKDDTRDGYIQHVSYLFFKDQCSPQ